MTGGNSSGARGDERGLRLGKHDRGMGGRKEASLRGKRRGKKRSSTEKKPHGEKKNAARMQKKKGFFLMKKKTHQKNEGYGHANVRSKKRRREAGEGKSRGGVSGKKRVVSYRGRKKSLSRVTGNVGQK